MRPFAAALLLVACAHAPPGPTDLERRLSALEARLALAQQAPRDEYFLSLRAPPGFYYANTPMGGLNPGRSLLGVLPSLNCSGPSAACSATSFLGGGGTAAAPSLVPKASVPTTGFSIGNLGNGYIDFDSGGLGSLTFGPSGTITIPSGAAATISLVLDAVSINNRNSAVNLDASGVTVRNNSSSATAFTVNTITGQTGNLQDWKINGAAALASVLPTGVTTNSAFTGTAASGTGVTANYTSNIRSWVSKVTVTSAAMTAATTTDISIVPATPVNSAIRRVTADVTQVFTGGALTAVTVMCGNSAGGNQYLLANSVFTAQNTWGDVAAEVGASLLSATWADFGTSAAGVPGAITVSCRFTCTTANCNAATQGSVSFYVEGVTY